jgi:hypothetical protein
MSPSEIVSKMVSLHCAATLAKEGGYAMRAGYDANAMLHEILAGLLESGDLLAWSRAYEDQELRAKCEVRFA